MLCMRLNALGISSWSIFLFKLTLWITFAATKPSASCSTNGVVSSLNRSCQHLTTPSKPLFEILYRHMNVHSCSHIIIFGYWVGPDIDDGWGYVEAFVNQITWQENSFFLLATVLLACLAVYEILMNGELMDMKSTLQLFS